jgi:hypothetical protein
MIFRVLVIQKIILLQFTNPQFEHAYLRSEEPQVRKKKKKIMFGVANEQLSDAKHIYLMCFIVRRCASPQLCVMQLVGLSVVRVTKTASRNIKIRILFSFFPF